MKQMPQTSLDLLHYIQESDKRLEIKEKWAGFHAYNPFIANTSASRGYMMATHHTQKVSLLDGDQKIILTGLEQQFSKNTISKKADSDCNVIRVINSYNDIGRDYTAATIEKIVITQNIETSELDYIDMPYKHTAQGSFGFKYKWNTEGLYNAINSGVIRKGTILADAPTVEDSHYTEHRD